MLKVGVHGTTVKYYLNDTVLYTSKTAATFPLYLDTSIYSPGGRLVGALLCAGGSCTNSPTAPPYTSYYGLSGKTVGMRRANYSAGNGQFRLVEDYLGSTTLVVDASLTVVQRQYSKPYGETAWQYISSSAGGESLTNVGYTGQRTDQDSTGLMFYNARMYDPLLSSFISADVVSPSKSDVQERNRYSYVQHNPLGTIDPSGHDAETAEGHPDNDIQCNHNHDDRECDEARARLRHFGFDVQGLWYLSELNWVLEAIHDLLGAVGVDKNDAGTFRRLLGIGPQDLILLVAGGGVCDGDQMCSGAGQQGYAEIVAFDRGRTTDIWKQAVADGYDNSFETYFKYGLVHEFGHLMAHHKDSPAFGHIFKDDREGVSDYARGHYKSKYTGDEHGYNQDEDWAETVAVVVYPGVRINAHEGDHYGGPGHPQTEARKNAVRGYLGTFKPRNPNRAF